MNARPIFSESRRRPVRVAVALCILIILALSLVSSGCISSITSTNTGNQILGQFYGDPHTGEAPLTVQFTDISTNSPISWNWSFGDGNYSNLWNPVHTYVSPGCYVATLTNSDRKGITYASSYDCIYVVDPSTPKRNWTILNLPSGYWIRIDPISNKQVGDNLTITATTNLSAGEDIVVQVYRNSYHSARSQSGMFSGATGKVKVMEGRDGYNTTSFNTSLLHFRVDDYIVYETAFNENASGTAHFKVNPFYWIKLDPISDKKPGDIFTVNATTNLPVGEELVVTVNHPTEWTGSQPLITNPKDFHGGRGTATVIPGRNGINTISFVVDSNEFNLIPENYIIYEGALGEDAVVYSSFNITPRV